MSAKITISKTEYSPGETISGQVSWHGSQDVRTAEVRLFWQTQGKGSVDVGGVIVQELNVSGMLGQATFSFIAPEAPPSFSGRLVSLVWGIELVLEPQDSVSAEIVIAPGGIEISLDQPEWLEMDDPIQTKGQMGI